VFHLQKVMVLAVLATVGLGVAVTAFSGVGGPGGTGPEEGVHGAPPAIAP
jgi:hypothetical protein